MAKGYIHVYTGNGKGKTTAAIGLAIRAAGAGKRVFIAQFVKGMHYSELDSLKRFEPDIILKQFGRDCFIKSEPVEEDIRLALNGLHEVSDLVGKNYYDMLILDEACIAIYYNLFSMNDLKRVLEKRHTGMEIIITGRYAPDELIEMADLVTEMREVKHYYNTGVQARPGIEF